MPQLVLSVRVASSPCVWYFRADGDKAVARSLRWGLRAAPAYILRSLDHMLVVFVL